MYDLPGPKSLEILKKGPKIFKYGGLYEELKAEAALYPVILVARTGQATE